MKGTPAIAGTLLLLILVVFLVLPATAQEGTVTRGGTITVTVVGIPRTAYDIWVAGTSDMSGEPGDQPPVIVPGQVDVQQDDPAGPYTIGSTPIRGGGTILDDVAPSSSVVPATSYYALVTTDIQGYGTVLFRTSAATATDRQFHIRAQDPGNPGEDVQVVRGVPAAPPTPTPTMMVPLPLPATMETPFLPAPTTTVPVTPVPTTPVPATTLQPEAATITPAAEETPTETAPTQGIPLPGIVAIAAAGIGILFASSRRGAG
ncbi:MAG TPA: hypothetical protein VMT31_02360 [Methanomicrobiales archaeon]|nr:hypothetical protein [Methanomicrobiales archaeon]